MIEMTEKTELTTTEGANLPQQYDTEKLALIKRMYAKGTTNDEFAVFMELAKRYELDPFSKQIWAVKYNDQPANIFCGRDGYLAIAHRSGQFNGMESGTKGEGKDMIGWCKVYRKDMRMPFSVEVHRSEYDTGKSVWASKPRTMIQKVAEAQALRRAFSISGLYSPEEFDTPDMKTIEGLPSGICEMCKENPVNEEMSEKLAEHTGGKLICRKCAFDVSAEISRQKRADKKPVTPSEKASFDDEPMTITGTKCQRCGTIETDEEIIAEAQNKHKEDLCRDCLKKADQDKAESEKPKEAPKKKQTFECEDCPAEVDKKQATESRLKTGKILCNVCQNAFEQDAKREE